MLMTTEPGDLVLDPTCGSGTSAFVAEQWGRRWIAIDASRVAIAIARQRLLTTTFEHYRTADEAPDARAVDPGRGFVNKTVAHITLKSIAQNRHLDPIFAKYEAKLEALLAECSAALRYVTEDHRRALAAKALSKQKAERRRTLTEADERRWSLPKDRFEHWTVPFDVDEDHWPDALQSAVAAYRRAWRAKMDEVDACIQANAEQEVLVDQPEVVKGVTRVSGPFTVEGVLPAALSPNPEPGFDGEPDALEAFHLTEASPDDYLERLTERLRDDGITYPNNQRRRFARLDRFPATDGEGVLHAEGEFAADDGQPDPKARVAVSFGPQYGPVTAMQVEDCIREARRAGYDHLVLAGFSFAPEATTTIEQASVRNLNVHRAHIRPDVNPGMDGLLKDKGSWQQLFTVFGEPEIEVAKGADGYTVKLKGVDIYDPVSGVVRSTGADKVAAWFLDADHDGRTFCVSQAFFPDEKAWEKIARALKSEVDESVFAAFSGTRSLPFPAGKLRAIAVKVIDPRGNEVMVVRKLEG